MELLYEYSDKRIQYNMNQIVLIQQKKKEIYRRETKSNLLSGGNACITWYVIQPVHLMVKMNNNKMK